MDERLLQRNRANIHLPDYYARSMLYAMKKQNPAARYFTGKPCRRGHIAERYVTTRTCVACAAERCVEWQASNKRKYLDSQNTARRLRLFGVTPERYHEILLAQNNGCAICGRTNWSGRVLAVDHDHNCCPTERTCGACIRGLLCDNCNHGLGKFRDDINLLNRAVRYLKK